MQNIDGIEIVNLHYEKFHAYHLYIIRITKDFPISRDELHLRLFKKAIRTTVHYKPVHMFSYFKRSQNSKNFLNSTKAFNECLSLPLFSTITRKQQDYVIENIIKIRK